MQNDNPVVTPFLRPAAAAQFLGIGHSSIWAKAKNDPDFPKAIKLGARTTVFDAAALMAYVQRKAQGGAK